jgi:hypothetical protein
MASSASSSPATSVGSLVSNKWSTASPHRGDGGVILYAGNHAMFKKFFATSVDDTNGWMMIPGNP